MPKIEAYRCDSCNRLIEDSRDIYKLQLAGKEWITGPPKDYCQNILDLGFCKECALEIKESLRQIVERTED
jgi:hypothetical protein